MDADRADRDPSPKGGVALVTGGARRIGRAIVEALHADGMRVMIHHRRSSSAGQGLADSLNAVRPHSALTVTADLLEPDAADQVHRAVVDGFGRLDVLVNNASSFYPTPVGEITETDWDDLVGTNLKAPLFVTQALTPMLRVHRGCVVNLADIHGQRPLADHPVYCAAKAGLIMLTKSLAQYFGPEIRVNAISPGPILWPESGAEGAANQSSIIESTALQRMGEPADIARLVRFLVREAPYITGQNFAIDGGRTLGR